MPYVITKFTTIIVKVRKVTKIMNQYNQVQQLMQDTTWERYPNTINITNKSQEVSLFPAGDHKSAFDRRESKKNEKHKIDSTNDPQNKYRLGTVSKNILQEGFNQFHGAILTLSSDVDQDT